MSSIKSILGEIKNSQMGKDRTISGLAEQVRMCLNGQAKISDEMLSLRETQGPTPSTGQRSINERPPSPAAVASNSREGDWVRRSEFTARKIELPVFSGDDPDEWTFRADRYFGLQRLNPTEQLEAAVLCLEGAALRWFRWENSRQPINSWEELKEMVIRRFRPAHEGTVYDRFFQLQQQATSVQEYRRRFEALAASMGQMSDQALLAAFVNGLKMEVQGPLRLLEPNGLIKAMELAESIEANQALIRPINSFFNSEATKGTHVQPHMSSPLSPASSSSSYKSTQSSTSPTRFKKYTEAELREKRNRDRRKEESGYLLSCDRKRYYGNKLERKKFNVLVTRDEDEDEEAAEINQEQENKVELETSTTLWSQVSGDFSPLPIGIRPLKCDAKDSIACHS
ncbi:hypothetical protein G4B88_003247 [Cannabis sativa]|uniref:Retrotransposon gag domain-containing protein n=1 Tax=Cannabis sativa TaxID=3483 RepID=A0A7J6I4R5_CANSA|nr:hypothetical protein G4B88_003247 [Cannabis sativa]